MLKLPTFRPCYLALTSLVILLGKPEVRAQQPALQPAAADTIFTLQQARAILLKKNFYLLGAYYEIGQAESQLLQAKMWNNPLVSWNQEAYNIAEDRYFRAKNQFEAQVSQTISLAGKHTNTVKLARINVELNKVQFQDVIRSLLFELDQTYNDLAAVTEKEELYSEVLASYQRLIATSEKELQVGAISVTEDLRIKSEYIGVKAQALDNANSKEKALSQLRILLQFPIDTVIRVQQRIPLFNNSFVLDSLIRHSLNVRPDLKAAGLLREYESQNVKLQKSLSLPDMAVGFDYDKGGNYIKQYSGLTLAMPLPVFDRNQGRIKEAQYGVKQSNVRFDYLKLSVVNQVVAAYNQYQRNNQGLSSYTDEFLNKLDQLHRNTNIYFQKRDISLLEFIDQQRIYISTYIQLIELKQQYLNSVNQLNFSVGDTLIDY